MKRRIILKLCVFLLLGAIVNVTVAWGCTYFKLTTLYWAGSSIH